MMLAVLDVQRKQLDPGTEEAGEWQGEPAMAGREGDR